RVRAKPATCLEIDSSTAAFSRVSLSCSFNVVASPRTLRFSSRSLFLHDPPADVLVGFRQTRLGAFARHRRHPPRPPATVAPLLCLPGGRGRRRRHLPRVAAGVAAGGSSFRSGRGCVVPCALLISVLILVLIL
ncbi:unnamed protein product, partial [Ectocarpus sp. 4 AP-2014]